MTPNHRIEVARGQDHVYIRVTGHGNMNNASSLRDFCDEELRQGYLHFCFDFQHCTGIDSTFMGLMAGIMQFTPPRGGEVRVIACNVPDSIRDLLNNLGLLNFITLVDKPITPPSVELKALDAALLGPVERLEVIKACHEQLMEIDERNKKTFGPFIKTLTEELNRQKPR